MSERPDGGGEAPLGLEPRIGSGYDPSLDAAAQVAEERRAEMEAVAAEVERRARRRTLLIGGAVAFAVVLLSAGIAFWTVRRPTSGAVTVGSGAFDAEGLAVPGATAAQFSPDGTRLAVLRGGGALGLAEGGRFRPLLPEQATISAFAWYGDTRLLVQEGPVSTGQLVAVDITGEERGVVKLDPDVAPGTGMAVSPDRRTVVLVGTNEEGSPGSRPVVDLYAVEVPGGRTRRLTDTADAESHPVFLDDLRVAFTDRRDGEETVVVLDLAAGTEVRLTAPSARSTVIGVAGGEVVWTTGQEVRAGRPGSPDRRVADVPRGTVAVALGPEQRRLVVRETAPEGDTVLRLVRL